MTEKKDSCFSSLRKQACVLLVTQEKGRDRPFLVFLEPKKRTKFLFSLQSVLICCVNTLLTRGVMFSHALVHYCILCGSYQNVETWKIHFEASLQSFWGPYRQVYHSLWPLLQKHRTVVTKARNKSGVLSGLPCALRPSWASDSYELQSLISSQTSPWSLFC